MEAIIEMGTITIATDDTEVVTITIVDTGTIMADVIEHVLDTMATIEMPVSTNIIAIETDTPIVEIIVIIPIQIEKLELKEEQIVVHTTSEPPNL